MPKIKVENNIPIMIPPSTNSSIQKLCIEVNLCATAPISSWFATDPPAPKPMNFESWSAFSPLSTNSLLHSSEPPTSIWPLRYSDRAWAEFANSLILGF